jgi:hypothetical protein
MKTSGFFHPHFVAPSRSGDVRAARTSNIERPTSNIELPSAELISSMLDVGRSMLDVRRASQSTTNARF